MFGSVAVRLRFGSVRSGRVRLRFGSASIRVHFGFGSVRLSFGSGSLVFVFGSVGIRFGSGQDRSGRSCKLVLHTNSDATGNCLLFLILAPRRAISLHNTADCLHGLGSQGK